MTTRTTIRSWPALGLAGVFLAGTSFVLFNDIAFNGAPITTSHVLTALALIAATAAGHLIVKTFRARRIFNGIGMVLLTAAALGYVATMSGARNAEQAAYKAERIEGANGQREALKAQRDAMAPERARSQAMLDAAQKGIADECRTGEGTRCRGRRATAEVYANALAGIDAKLAAIDARMDALGGPQTPNAGYKAAAEAIVLAGLTSRSQAEVEKALIVLLPWLAVLIAELGTIVFLSSALGHREVVAFADSRQTSFAGPVTTETASLLANLDPENDPPKGRRKTKSLPRTLPPNLKPRALPANVVPIRGKHPVISALEFAGKPLSNEELADVMNVSGGESTKRRREVADLIDEFRQGHRVMVGLKKWQRAMA